jgi:CRISPR-associated protein (TIGR02584 family)
MEEYRNLLVAVAGLTPQVITEMLFYLTVRHQPPIPVSEIHVVTTQPGKEYILQSLLAPRVGKFYTFCAEYDLDPTSIAFDAAHVHVLTDAVNVPLDDIRTVADNTTSADQILALIRHLTSDTSTRLYCSLAGGRKTQSVLLGFALQLYGRPQDRLLHVLVQEELEGHREFFYPPRKSCLLRDRNNRLIDAHIAQIDVAEIPYVRLRGKLPPGDYPPLSGFSPTVQRIQSSIDTLPQLPPLVIEVAVRKVHIGTIPIALEPLEIVLYAQLAIARAQRMGRADGFLSMKELNSQRAAMLTRYEQIYGSYSGHVENLHHAWEKGIPPARLRSHFAKIKRKIRHAVPGHVEVSFYEVTSGGYGTTRYGLHLPPERITVHEPS